MANAFYSDTMGFNNDLGEFETVEAGKAACIAHAKAHKFFRGILDEDLDDEGGYDMAAQIGTSSVRLYCVNP